MPSPTFEPRCNPDDLQISFEVILPLCWRTTAESPYGSVLQHLSPPIFLATPVFLSSSWTLPLLGWSVIYTRIKGLLDHTLGFQSKNFRFVLWCDTDKLRLFQILKFWFLFVLTIPFSVPPFFFFFFFFPPHVGGTKPPLHPVSWLTSATFHKTLEHSSATSLTTLQHLPLLSWAITCSWFQS